MTLRQRPDAEIGEELRLVQHPLQQLLHPMAAQQRQQPPFAAARLVPARHQARQVGPMAQEPSQPPLESGQLFEQLGLQHLDREERDQPDHRADAAA